MEKRGILTVFILTLTTLLISGLAYADLPTQGTHENVWGTHLVDWLNISFNTSNGMLDNITDELIVSGDIANNTILLQDLADNSVNSTKIVDGAIGNLDLGAITVINSTHLATAAVGADELALGVVNTSHIADGAIGNLDLGAITVINSTHLATAAVGADELAFGAVNATHLGSLTGAINTTHITDESINGSDILNNSIVLNKMASDSVNATALVGVSKILYGTCDVDVPNVTAQKQVNASCGASSTANVSVGDFVVFTPIDALDNLTISGVRVFVAGQINFTVTGVADGVATIVDQGATKFTYVAFVNGTG